MNYNTLYLPNERYYKNKNILSSLGIENLDNMEKSAKDTIIKGQNIFLFSPTDSGKTLYLLLPILRLLDENILNV